MHTPKYKPGPQVLQRAEELLREQLAEHGEDLQKLQPHEISAHMVCGVDAIGALFYSWKGEPLLEVVPEEEPSGLVWRFYTQDKLLQ